MGGDSTVAPVDKDDLLGVKGVEGIRCVEVTMSQGEGDIGVLETSLKGRPGGLGRYDYFQEYFQTQRV